MNGGAMGAFVQCQCSGHWHPVSVIVFVDSDFSIHCNSTTRIDSGINLNTAFKFKPEFNLKFKVLLLVVVVLVTIVLVLY